MVDFIDEHRERARGRADLRGVADRPVDLLRAQRAPRRSEPAPRRARSETTSSRSRSTRVTTRASTAVYGAEKVWQQLHREKVARRALHRRAADARHGASRRRARATRSRSRRSPTRGGSGRRISWSGSSTRRAPTSSGSPTSRTSRPGRASSTSPSSSTYSRAASSAGASRARCAVTSHSTPWSRRCTRGRTTGARAPSRSGHAIRQHSVHRAARRAGIERSVGSVGDSYDNALAETINGLYKTEVIRRRGPWRSIDDVEYATLDWVDWFNTPSTPRAARLRATGRVRSGVLSTAEPGHGRLTHVKQPPENPGRFNKQWPASHDHWSARHRGTMPPCPTAAMLAHRDPQHLEPTRPVARAARAHSRPTRPPRRRRARLARSPRAARPPDASRRDRRRPGLARALRTSDDDRWRADVRQRDRQPARAPRDRRAATTDATQPRDSRRRVRSRRRTAWPDPIVLHALQLRAPRRYRALRTGTRDRRDGRPSARRSAAHLPSCAATSTPSPTATRCATCAG